jgi:hypothetical protein
LHQQRGAAARGRRSRRRGQAYTWEAAPAGGAGKGEPEMSRRIFDARRSERWRAAHPPHVTVPATTDHCARPARRCRHGSEERTAAVALPWQRAAVRGCRENCWWNFPVSRSSWPGGLRYLPSERVEISPAQPVSSAGPSRTCIPSAVCS